MIGSEERGMSWYNLFAWLVGTPLPIGEFLSTINWYAMGIGFLTTLLMLVVRHEVRLARLRSILDFMKNFNLPELRHTTPSTAPSKARLDPVDNALLQQAGNTAATNDAIRQADENARPENPSFE
jgi:hypothetical protein